jgi:hypothetical protein
VLLGVLHDFSVLLGVCNMRACVRVDTSSNNLVMRVVTVMRVNTRVPACARLCRHLLTDTAHVPFALAHGCAICRGAASV